MPGTCPKSHVASGWIGFEMGTSSRWHHERVPHLSPCLNAPPSAPAPTGGQRPPPPPPPSTRGGFPPQKANKYVHPAVPTHTPPPPPPPHYCGSVSGGQFPRTVIQSVPIPSHWPTLGAGQPARQQGERRPEAGERHGGLPRCPRRWVPWGRAAFTNPTPLGEGVVTPPVHPPPPSTHPSYRPLPPPLKIFGQPYLPAFGPCNNLFGALGAFTDSASLGTGGGRGGWLDPPPPRPLQKKPCRGALPPSPAVLMCQGIPLHVKSWGPQEACFGVEGVDVWGSGLRCKASPTAVAMAKCGM